MIRPTVWWSVYLHGHHSRSPGSLCWCTHTLCNFKPIFRPNISNIIIYYWPHFDFRVATRIVHVHTRRAIFNRVQWHKLVFFSKIPESEVLVAETLKFWCLHAQCYKSQAFCMRAVKALASLCWQGFTWAFAAHRCDKNHTLVCYIRYAGNDGSYQTPHLSWHVWT